MIKRTSCVNPPGREWSCCVARQRPGGTSPGPPGDPSRRWRAAQTARIRARPAVRPAQTARADRPSNRRAAETVTATAEGGLRQPAETSELMVGAAGASAKGAGSYCAAVTSVVVRPGLLALVATAPAAMRSVAAWSTTGPDGGMVTVVALLRTLQTHLARAGLNVRADGRATGCTARFWPARRRAARCCWRSSTITPACWSGGGGAPARMCSAWRPRSGPG